MNAASTRPDIRVVLADAEGAFKARLGTFLRAQQGLHLVAETSDVAAALRFARYLKPGVVLLGWELNGAMGVLHELTAGTPHVRVIVLADDIGRDETLVALRLGSSGVVLHRDGVSVVARAIRCVTAGQYWYGRQSLADAIRALRTFSTTALAPSVRSADFGLTAREVDIVSAIAEGHGNKDIAYECSISEKTVKHHLTNIFKKLGVSSRLELGMFAVKHRIGKCLGN